MKDANDKYKVIIGILVAIIIFIMIMWHKSENNRLKLLDEYNEIKDMYEELRDKV